MTPENLLIECEEMKKRTIRSIYRYEYYLKSLERYILWMKEQIDKSKDGSIRVKRGDLALAMKKELEIIMGDKYRDKTYKSLYNIIRVVLFDEGIFADLGNYDRERIFIMRNRTPDDYLIPSLLIVEKYIKGLNN